MSAQNILAVYQLATAAETTEGQSWYGRASAIAMTLGLRYKISHSKAAAVIAALSPRNKWNRNVADAENLIEAYIAGGKEAADAIKVCTFTKNKIKAIQILELNDPCDLEYLAILSGPKLQEFYCCISGYDDEVCIDGHAYSIWSGGRITLANIPSIGKKLRAQIKADYREAANTLGLPAYQVQAVTWCAWRRIHGVAD